MKQLLLFTFILLTLSQISFSQISKGGLPYSFTSEIYSNADRLELKPLDLRTVYNEDEKFPKDGRPSRVGYSLNTDISMDNSGTWTELPNGDRLWQIQIKSPGALALGVYFDLFRIPVGSKLFLYNEDKSQVIGAFTWLNNDESKLFATEMIYGDIVNIEYYEPEVIFSKAEFHINNIAYFYRGVADHKNPAWTEPSDACEVNINCSPVGDSWQDEKHGVARMSIVIGGSYYWCSGSLVNNTNQNCTPYFLSAYHCYEGASASDLNQWIFYFNYEASGCTTPSTEPTSQTMTGASLKSSANIVGGSDFILLELNQVVPLSYNPYMNGWNRQNSFSGPGVGIHHPAGSIKKISTFSTATTGTYNSAASSAHWVLSWVSNSNGWGVTEGGSSGSPIFDANGRIVGTLTGGSSLCSQQTAADYYGKVYYHWDQNGSTAADRLKDWLDPAGSNPTTLNGKYCTGSAPVCDTADLMTSGLYWNSYANGNNSYGDKAKANYFAGSVNGNVIQDIYLQFIYATGTGSATINVWNNSGTGGSPGTAIAVKLVPISTIITDINASQVTHVVLTSPVILTGPCYVGVTLPTSAGDTVILAADTSASPSYNVAWEKWNTNVWYAYNSPSSWGKNAALAVWPVICSSLGIDENMKETISVYPNPVYNEIYLVLNGNEGEKVNISLYDIYGKLCKKTLVSVLANNPVSVDVSGLSEGLYFINGETSSGTFTQKILIVR